MANYTRVQKEQINAFIRDLMALQRGHGLLMTGRDNDFFFGEENVTEENIRKHWENYLEELVPKSGNLTE